VHKYFYGLLCGLVFLLASCSMGKQNEVNLAKIKEVTINDGYKTTKKGELIIDDTSLEGKQPPIVTSRKSSKEPPKTAADGSQISTMYDGFGNKTEIRTFAEHPLIQCIVSRTFADGRKNIFVYGQNGEVRNLPEYLYDKVLSSSGYELARSAGIFMGRKLRNIEISAQNSESTTDLTIQTIKNTSPISEILEKTVEKNDPEKEIKPDGKVIWSDLQKLELQAKKRQPEDQKRN
jgi:hypothetical protein